MRLSKPGFVRAGKISVEPGKFYTFRAYLRASEVPASSRLVVWAYDAPGKLTTWQEEWWSISKREVWQEATVEYWATETTSDVLIDITNTQEGAQTAMWIDDVYFAEGQAVLEQQSSAKRGFSGSRVRADDAGNFEVYQNGGWRPFFPFGLINNSLITEDKALELSNQGFNLTFANSAGILSNLKNATSVYNPNGMMAMVPAIHWSRFSASGDATALASYVSGLTRNDASAAIFSWYDEPTDGSKPLSDHPKVKKAYDIVRERDRANGTPGSPVFLSMGETGYPRSFGDATDLSGTFRYPLGEGVGARHLSAVGSGMRIAGQIEGATAPHSIATLPATDDAGVTRPTPAQLRAMVYHALWGGAKGIVFWWERQADGKSVKDTDLWPVFPKLRSEIDTVLPVLRQSNEPGWSVTRAQQPSSKRVDILKKEYGGHPYILIVNTEDTPVKTILRFSNLPSRARRAQEIFGQGDVAILKNYLSTTLEPYGTRVYRLTESRIRTR